jgi:hypothetical protein
MQLRNSDTSYIPTIMSGQKKEGVDNMSTIASLSPIPPGRRLRRTTGTRSIKHDRIVCIILGVKSIVLPMRSSQYFRRVQSFNSSNNRSDWIVRQFSGKHKPCCNAGGLVGRTGRSTAIPTIKKWRDQAFCGRQQSGATVVCCRTVAATFRGQSLGR